MDIDKINELNGIFSKYWITQFVGTNILEIVRYTMIIICPTFFLPRCFRQEQRSLRYSSYSSINIFRTYCSGLNAFIIMNQYLT